MHPIDKLFLALLLDTIDPLRGHPTGDVDQTLRHPCSPTEPVRGTGYHKHTCSCGTAWRHDDLLPMVPNIDEVQFREAHTCPTCRTEVREKDWTHG